MLVNECIERANVPRPQAALPYGDGVVSEFFHGDAGKRHPQIWRGARSVGKDANAVVGARVCMSVCRSHSGSPRVGLSAESIRDVCHYVPQRRCGVT